MRKSNKFESLVNFWKSIHSHGYCIVWDLAPLLMSDGSGPNEVVSEGEIRQKEETGGRRRDRKERKLR